MGVEELCLKGVTSIPATLTFYLHRNEFHFGLLVICLCTAVQHIMYVLHGDQTPFQNHRGDSYVNLSKPFGTTRQEPVSYLGLHRNQRNVGYF